MPDLQSTWWGDFPEPILTAFVVILAAGGLYVGLRQWHRNRLSAVLFVSGLLLLCGVYAATRPESGVEFSSVSSRKHVPVDHVENTQRLVENLSFITTVAIGLVLLAGLTDLRKPRRSGQYDKARRAHPTGRGV